jgi:FkbM family methyltransferase
MFEALPDSQDSFYQSILSNAIGALRLNTHFDNFDEGRFNNDGKDHSKEFNLAEHTFFFDWFFRNVGSLFQAYSWLADDDSKRLYLHLIVYRLAGHLSVKIPVDFRDQERYLEYKQRELHSDSALDIAGAFGNLRHFDFDYEGRKYVIDCLGLEYYLYRRQYCLERDGIVVRAEASDVVVDGGACLGDSAAVFSNAVGERGHVYAFDPVAEHLEVLHYNVNQFPIKNVSVMPFGLSDSNVDAAPIALNGYAPGFNATGAVVPLRSIDFLVESGQIPKVDYIKLDVEGFEAAVLGGAMRTITRFRPKLAVSLYHKPNDFFELVNLVNRHFAFYDCHIGHYTIHREETVLYCRPTH